MFNAVHRQPCAVKIEKLLDQLPEKDQIQCRFSFEYYFGEYLFPLINPEPFFPAYDSLKRPSYPINILIAAELYKQIKGLRDRRLIEAAHTPAVKIGFHLYDYFEGEKVFSRRALENFRSRADVWNPASQQDLKAECRSGLLNQIILQMNQMLLDPVLKADNPVFRDESDEDEAKKWLLVQMMLETIRQFQKAGFSIRLKNGAFQKLAGMESSDLDCQSFSDALKQKEELLEDLNVILDGIDQDLDSIQKDSNLSLLISGYLLKVFVKELSNPDQTQTQSEKGSNLQYINNRTEPGN